MTLCSFTRKQIMILYFQSGLVHNKFKLLLIILYSHVHIITTCCTNVCSPTNKHLKYVFFFFFLNFSRISNATIREQLSLRGIGIIIVKFHTIPISCCWWLPGHHYGVARVFCVISPSSLIVGVVSGSVYFSYTSTKDVDHVLLDEITATKMHAI